jgi:hypothetical protein
VSTAHAAYWVVDQNAPARGSIRDITDSGVVSMESYLYAKIPDSVLLAKDSKVCVKKYETLKNSLIAFDKLNKDNFSTEKTILARERIITRESKNITICLKKEGISEKTKIKTTPELSDLELRISIMESQIKDIIKALQSIGKLTNLKG